MSPSCARSIRDRRTELGFADPFRDMKIAWPLSSTSPRKTLADPARLTLNKVFVHGVESGYLEEAILPLMAYLTGRRIGLLLHLRDEDFRQRDGVWIVFIPNRISVLKASAFAFPTRPKPRCVPLFSTTCSMRSVLRCGRASRQGRSSPMRCAIPIRQKLGFASSQRVAAAL